MNVIDTIEYDREQRTYRAQYEETRDDPNIAIVEAVAAIEQIEPTAAETLRDRIEPEALDAILRSANDCHVQFAYQGYHVAIDSDGIIELQPDDPSRTVRT